MNIRTRQMLPMLIGAALICVSVFLRYVSYPVVSGDYTTSLSHWMDALRGAGGLSAFQHTFSDYPPLYLYLLKIIAYLPGFDLYWIKALSIVFDIVLSVLVYYIVHHVSGKSAYSFLAAAVVFALPTVILNSSLWAQCDVIYTTFILLSVLCIMKDKSLFAVCAFAIAISFKLQAIFFAPVLIGYLLTKKTGWALFVLIPVIFVATLVPAVVSGGSFIDLAFTYAKQASEFQDLTLSAPSMYSLFDTHALSASFRLTLEYIGYILAGITAILVMIQTKRLFSDENVTVFDSSSILFISLISVLCVPFFLPHMHERYFYLADVISVVYAFADPKHFYIPIIVVLSSFFAYMPFLSGSVPWFGHIIINLGICAAVLGILIVSLLPRFFSVVQSKPLQANSM